jgi:hypothetical protein
VWPPSGTLWVPPEPVVKRPSLAVPVGETLGEGRVACCVSACRGQRRRSQPGITAWCRADIDSLVASGSVLFADRRYGSAAGYGSGTLMAAAEVVSAPRLGEWAARV